MAIPGMDFAGEFLRKLRLKLEESRQPPVFNKEICSIFHIDAAQDFVGPVPREQTTTRGLADVKPVHYRRDRCRKRSDGDAYDNDGFNVVFFYFPCRDHRQKRKVKNSEPDECA